MTTTNSTPPTIAQRLLNQSRRNAGLDTHRQPVRLGEMDTDGHVVGYIDESGTAWESLPECLTATLGGRLGEALSLPREDPRRGELLEQVTAEVPDELIKAVAEHAGFMLYLRNLGPTS